MPRHRRPGRNATTLLAAVLTALLGIHVWSLAAPSGAIPPHRTADPVRVQGDVIRLQGARLTIRPIYPDASGPTQVLTLGRHLQVRWMGPGHPNEPRDSLRPGEAIAATVRSTADGLSATVIFVSDAVLVGTIHRWQAGLLELTIPDVQAPVPLRLTLDTAWHLPEGDVALLHPGERVRAEVEPGADGSWQAAALWVASPGP